MSAPANVRRIVLATEGTEFDVGAEHAAIVLAQRLAADLMAVLPLASNPEYLSAEPELALQAEQRAANALSALRTSAAAQGVGLRTTIRGGDVLWREIVETAADADLLVTRRVGKRGFLARLLVGEMVSQVAAHARCPVLMVPATVTALWSDRVHVVAAAPSDASIALATVLARTTAASIAPVEDMGQLAAVAARAGAKDLLVIGLSAAQIVAGRLVKDVEAAIGAAACPALLVPPGAAAPVGRAP
jgi:nucleotide-binding universal stress UspA family protein